MSADPVAARPLDEDDAAVLGALEAAVFGDDGWTAPMLRSQLARPDGIALGQQQAADGALAGAALGWAAGGVAELLRIEVHPDQRRRGLGALLLAHFVTACRSAGAEELWLEVRADNTAALALYRTAGMTQTGRRHHYYSDGCDAVLMGQQLAD